MLVRAIELADTTHVLWPRPDRERATEAARAQHGKRPSNARTGAREAAAFVARRAAFACERLGQGHQALAAARRSMQWPGWLWWLLPVAAFVLGFASNALGPDRLVTRAEHNVVYSLDDQPALDLYKRYLGPLAEHLPHSALFFPLAIHDGTGDRSAIVRSALTIDEDSGSVGFAGGVREGMYARLMKMNAESVIDGAAQAAREAAAMLGGPAALALAVSCYGRRQVLGQRAEEELEAVADALGGAALAGFYAYGEFAPTAGEPGCTLHNQTMTVTALAER